MPNGDRAVADGLGCVVKGALPEGIIVRGRSQKTRST
jgi:hypothetical protein